MSDQGSDNLTDLVTNLNFDVMMKPEVMGLEVGVRLKEPKMQGSRKSARLKYNQEDNDRLTDTDESGNENMDVKFASAWSLHPIRSGIVSTSHTLDFKIHQSQLKGEKQLIVHSNIDDDDDVEVDEKKYGVYIVPDLEAEYKVICKKPILSGATICMNDRCRIKAHRVLEKVPFPKG